jgi:hypothetical protein
MSEHSLLCWKEKTMIVFIREHRGKIWILILLMLMLLAGCGAGRTMVLAPPETSAKFSSAELYEDKAAVSVPSDVSTSFQAKLGQLLYGSDGFTRGPGLKIRYRFIQFNPGNQFTRWFWGETVYAGRGSMTVEVRFFDSSDRELAKIQSTGEVASGAFGGSFGIAVQKTAKDVAGYAKRLR